VHTTFIQAETDKAEIEFCSNYFKIVQRGLTNGMLNEKNQDWRGVSLCELFSYPFYRLPRFGIYSRAFCLCKDSIKITVKITKKLTEDHS
jgi:hypothetical protein